MRLPHRVVFSRHGAIIADDKILVRFESDGGPFPIARKFHVRLAEPLSIDERLPIVESDRLTGKTYDPLHVSVAREMNARVREADEDNIATARFVKQIREAIHNMNAVGFI